MVKISENNPAAGLVVNPEFKYKKLWLGIGYALVLFVVYLSVTSSPPEIDTGFEFQDKLFHALAYFSIMFWFAQIYHINKQRLICALAFVFLGIAMEGVQSFDPKRYAEFNDMVANTFGVAIGILLTKKSLKNMLCLFEKRFLK